MLSLLGCQPLLPLLLLPLPLRCLPTASRLQSTRLPLFQR
jgi:hypothetical protein